MQTEKVRIFSLARELGMESRDLVNLCRQAGIDVKNQLSTVETEVRDQIVALVSRGSSNPAAKPAPVAPVVPARTNEPLRNLDTRRPTPQPTVRPGSTAPSTQGSVAAPPTETSKTPVTTATLSPPAKAPETTVRHVEPTASKVVEPTPAAAPRVDKPVETVTPAPTRATEKPAETPARAVETPPAARTEAPTPATPPPSRQETPPPGRVPEATGPRQPPTPPPQQPRPVGPIGGPSGVRNLNQPRPTTPGGSAPPSGGRDRPRDRPPPTGRRTGIVAPPPPKPIGAQNKPRPTQNQDKPAAKPAGPVKLDIPIEAIVGKTGSDTHLNLQQHFQQGGVKPAILNEIPDILVDDEDDGKGKKGDKGKRRPGELIGRDSRRNERQKSRKVGGEEDVRHGKVLLLDDDQPRKARRPEKKKIKRPTEPRKGKVPVQVPITIRALSEAIGTRSTDLLSKLFSQGIILTINSTLEPEMAEILAHEFGCELDIKRAVNVEEDLETTHAIPNKPEDLQPRAPVVTIMGHVDHGKTSLLDKIRRSNVAATEAGGITQVIRAWRVEHGGHPVTFLDTPGHEAFTKMRARGANVTDIAVIVVAVDDGVMPQTEEAISHAKAAGVSIVVAINKVDLPNANIKKTEQQLYGLGLIPDNMGGDVPFVYTSAATGKGIDELLEQLSVVAELKELKANPNKPGRGICLESHLSEGEGVLATVLVQDGTLRRGDIIVCGAGSGRVRAMYNDLGKPINEAGPSVPVVVTGLDLVPNADDKFLVVPDLATAGEIANKRRSRLKDSNIIERKPITIDNLRDLKVTELKVILKAEARGSIEAIRKELEKLQHDEVRVRLLHTAIGGITESDVQLALTSPQDTFIVGFNVVPDERARALAEERGVTMRQYNIIYNLTADIRSALEGKLKPREEIIHLGRAVVRETFKISRVGTIAGCRVTQGVIERSGKIRLIRGGVVIYPPAERTAGLESLKRFKDDVRDVREGFDCGIKIAGYDDIKVDDIIEAYRVEHVQRTLDDAAAGR